MEDLYRLPRAYLNTYAFVYCFDTDLQPRDAERIDTALQEYPWKGGFSYVNVYSVLRNQIPVSERPLIKAIEYHSPGSIDLLLNVDVAVQIAKSVGILLGTAVAAAKTYAAIYKTLADIKKDRADRSLKIARLNQAQLRVLMGMYDDLAKHLGYKNASQLHERTKDPEVSLKLLLAHYRWLRRLSRFVKERKAELPAEIPK